MGSLCGKESSPDPGPFSQPGRTLNAPPPTSKPSVAPLPRTVVGGPARTLGGATSSPQTQTDLQTEDARRKAADAAEARAQAANRPKGKLGNRLQEQKRATRADTLDAGSREERRLRDADAGAESRAYN